MSYNPRQAPVVAPDKGSFPLDHEGQCKEPMKELMACLKANSGESFPCRKLSVAYLECRMSKGLMAAEPLDGLGFKSDQMEAPVEPSKFAQTSNENNNTRVKERSGYISGLEAKPLPKETR